MIILHVTFRTKPGMAGEFVTRVLEEGIAQASEAEGGNYYYDFYHSAEQADEVMLLEKWENQDALNVHVTLPHYKRIGELQAEYVVDAIVEKYEIKEVK